MVDPAYIHQLLRRLAEVETLLADSSVVANQRQLQDLMVEHARLQAVRACADRYFRILRERDESEALLRQRGVDPGLVELARAEIERLDAERPVAERELLEAMLPPDPEDHRSTIVEIRAGTGGEEAALFAADLFRMYNRYAERRGWKVGLMDASPSSLGGYKEVIFAVDGRDVYHSLRYESGVHRVQRIPVTEASGRIHTSTATVAVLPEAEEVEVEIKPDDLRIDVYRSSGPGGQSVNRTDSAVRITHLPTGLVVQSQDERSQHRNRERALRVLRARLLDRKRREEQERVAAERRTQIGTGDRSERIRTYNFPQNRLTDHRINLTLYHLDAILDGDLDPVVQALCEHDLALRLQQQIRS